jgi:mono/diheme cytochrome c family protein
MTRLFSPTIGLTALLIASTIRGAIPIGAQQNSSSSAKRAAIELFENRVRPLLIERCVSCHGADRQSAGLRLDSAAGIGHGGRSGPILVPGDPDHSRLIAAVRYETDLKMPPTGKLAAADIETLANWIKMGAPWPQSPLAPSTPQSSPYGIHPERRNFWAFQPVRRPKIPKVKQPTWVKTPIDAFILAGLERQGLRPAQQADRRTLIRRATFDLTGLPPTPEEVQAFCADRSPDAWEKVVDRLLASPRYGERWGRHWLDVVRYCDSLDARGLGSEGDISEAWRYRDWVVNALNRDMPYSDFMMNQVAGDLLPNQSSASHATTQTIAGQTPDLNVEGTVATGMLAIGNWGNGDADKEKILTDIADDQLDVVSRGFMGLTIGCARCHDHKFDPISTKDYYGLAGIFFSTHILPKLTPKGAGETPLRVPLITRADAARRDAYAAEIRELETRRKAMAEGAYREMARAMRPQAARYVLAAWEYANRPDDQAAKTLPDYARQQGLQEYALRQWSEYLGWGDFRLMTQPIRDLAGNGGVQVWKGAADTPSLTVNTNAAARTIQTFTLPPRSVCVHPGPTSGVSVGWKSPVSGVVSLTGRVADADPACGDGIAWVVEQQGRAGRVGLAQGDFPNGGKQELAAGQGAERLERIEVHVGETVRLIVLPKANHFCDTTVVEFEIKAVGTGKTWNLTHDLLDDPLQSNPHRDGYGNNGVWSFCDMGEVASNSPQASDAALRTWRTTIATIGPLERGRAERAALDFAGSVKLADDVSPFLVRRREDEAALPVSRRQELANLDGILTTLQKTPPPPVQYANAAQEGGVPESSQAGFHDVHVHIRGSYLRLGDLVPRHFPVVLAGQQQPPITQGSGRLELARWLASPTHPLTARVMVNRIWQHHFGEGIVRTPSNFGYLGERPTNPELLDWLADRFVASGWSMKQMHRLILLSATYQQSAQASAKTLSVDPANRLNSRISRQRLEAEAIRDSLLAVAGKLDTTMGGAAVRDFNTPRRSLYIMTIRSDRTGFGSLFDSADSTSSIDHRTSSTVAPQALYLMNDVFVLTQARALAARILKDAPQNDTARIQRLYPIVYGRPVTPAEIQVGLKLLAHMRGASTQTTQQGSGAAQRVAGDNGAGANLTLTSTREGSSKGKAGDGELTAWTAYCQVLICANEFMFVD